MKTFIIVVGVIILVVFLGGAVPLGSAPLFGHIDSILGTDALMSLHYAMFSIIYRGEDSMDSGVSRTKDDIDDFEKAPLGFDKRKKYKQLDNAAEN